MNVLRTLFAFFPTSADNITTEHHRICLHERREGKHQPVNTVDGLHVLAFVILGLTLAHGVLAIAEHYFPGSEATVAGRFIVGGAC